ncbi:MAG: hypothetical protein AAFY26_23885, partial [Cyanobacteria bacterium J06638_22]
KDLTIEVFLPQSLLQLAVEAWERKGFDPDFSMRVGYDYQVCVRSTERWKEYGSFHQERWEDKWQQLNAQLNARAHTLVADIDEKIDYGDLLAALGDMLAFKLDKAPADNTIFNAVLETAIPVGLWLRQDLPYPLTYQIGELTALLACCLRELPQRVQKKRAETRKQEYRSADCHIGHHLVLLWEDPHRLPPIKPEYAPDL